MKCEKCGDEKVYVAGGEGLGQVCLSCAFQGADYASKPDRFEMFDLKKYQDKAREMREIWRKFSEDTSKYISNESPCDDSMRERPLELIDIWDGKIDVVENGVSRRYTDISGMAKPSRDALRCPKCRCTVNFVESAGDDINPDAMSWFGECDDCDAQIEFHFFRVDNNTGKYAFLSKRMALGVDWDAELKKLPKRA